MDVTNDKFADHGQGLCARELRRRTLSAKVGSVIGEAGKPSWTSNVSNVGGGTRVIW